MAKAANDWVVKEHALDDVAGMWYLTVERGDEQRGPFSFSVTNVPRNDGESDADWSRRVLAEQVGPVLASLRAEEPDPQPVAGSEGFSLADLQSGSS